MDRQQTESIQKIIDEYREKPGSLIQVLHEIQTIVGYLPEEVQEMVARGLSIPISEVNSVLTFYALFSEKPKGKYNIGICKGTACYVRGSAKILEKLGNYLGIEPGDSTDDGLFSIQVVRCLGACGLGPVMTVNDQVYTLMNAEKAVAIIRELQEKEQQRMVAAARAL